jgi:hypothetical protein
MTIRQPASRRLRQPQSFRPNVTTTATSTTRPRSRTVKLSASIQLINEALSRARMRRPQEVGTSEAYRSARQIMISARRQQTRMLGE